MVDGVAIHPKKTKYGYEKKKNTKENKRKSCLSEKAAQTTTNESG